MYSFLLVLVEETGVCDCDYVIVHSIRFGFRNS